ncbi:MAG: hypothetical protein ACM3Q2_10530 [Syntrophothermus sp.]
MRNKNLNEEIHRQCLTIEEAAFMLRVSQNTFLRRFVATEKIYPIIFDEDQGDQFLFDIDDLRILVKKSRKQFRPGELGKIIRERSKKAKKSNADGYNQEKN